MKLFKPYMSWRAIFNVVKVLLSGQLAEGPQVKLFEHEFSTKFNLSNVVAVNSGTSALELAYELAGITRDDEVITPVLTCTATNLPLVRRGARVVFADVDYDLNINIEDVKRKITSKTKAIVFVHFGGNNRGLQELLELARSRNLVVIEDAAQAIGSDYWGKADFTAVSLQAIKTLTSGDGGLLICNKLSDYKKAKRLRWFGYDREEKQKQGDTDITEAGYKYHMSDITAAIGRGNLRSIDKVIAKRKKLATLFKSQPGFHCHAWLCIYWHEDAVAYVKSKGIPTSQHHYRNDKYTVFKESKGTFPQMDFLENRWTLIPFHHGISLRQAKKIIHALH